PQLTGETDRWVSARADPRQHKSLTARGPRQSSAVADDANAASRAARAPAADAGMGDFEAQAGLEHTEPLRHAHLPVGVGHCEGTASALAQGTHAACREHECNRACIPDREVKQRDVIYDRTLRRRDRSKILATPLRVLGKLDDLSRAVVRAKHGEWRQQNRDREENGRCPFEEWLHSQPEI